MKTQKLLMIASFTALIANVAFAAVALRADDAIPGAKPAVVSPNKPEAALTKAMPADTVRQIMGQPSEIKFMKAPNGKAEIWVYKREAGQHIDRVQIGTVPITMTKIGEDGKAYQYTVGEKVQFADLRCATEETIQLLMFNNHLLLCKVSSQEVRRYN